MTKLEMVRAILDPQNKPQEDYAERVSKRMLKPDIEAQYKAFLKSGVREIIRRK